MQVREVPVAETRPLRQSVLRSHETIEQVAADEPAEAFAAGGFDRERLIAVGLIAPSEQAGSFPRLARTW